MSLRNASKSSYQNLNIQKLISCIAIATYYTAGVMGKRKYQAVRLASSMKSGDLKRGGG